MAQNERQGALRVKSVVKARERNGTAGDGVAHFGSVIHLQPQGPSNQCGQKRQGF